MKKLALMAVAVVALFLMASVAMASEVLTLNDGAGDSLTFTDGGVLTTVGSVTTLGSSASAGDIYWNGNIGSWTLSTDTGLSKPAVGTSVDPQLDLLSGSGKTSAAGTLTINLTDSGFTYDGLMVDGVGGTMGTSMTGRFATFVDGLPVDVMPNTGSFTTGSFSGSGEYNVNLAPTDTLSLEDVITASAATGSNGSPTTWDQNTNVPEPSTLLLLGAGLLCAAFFMRKVAKV